jgi:small-conductance mechanosensitive channel
MSGEVSTVTGPVSLHEWIVAAIDIAAGVLAALVLRLALRWLARRAQRTRWRADDMVLALLGSVAPWGAIVAGVWAAVLGLPLARGARSDADHVLLAAVVLIATLGIAGVTTKVVRAGALSHAGTSGSATIFVNIARVLVLVLGLLVLLESLGVAITPLLTALGVGGLAVALALQDTLTNLFAGVHILASGKVQPGDFIQLDNGMQGYVVDTNWRNTTIRQLPDNLVIVPNATVAASVLTNYNRPQQEMSVRVQVGVAYDSDLDHVERVTCDVGREVMQGVEGGIRGHEPFIRYHTFADSSINFSVILRAREVTAQYLIVHEFIKRLHRRYQLEGIQIPFPVRTVVPQAAGRGPAAGPEAEILGPAGNPALAD